jgi:hypothetical protein
MTHCRKAILVRTASTVALPAAALLAGGATLIISASLAGADVPAGQHPRLDPTVGCVLLPDPGSSGDKLYPAGDDTAAGPAGQTLRLDVLANDCANSAPDTAHTWSTTPPVLPAQFAAGDYSAPVGDISSDDSSLTFTPKPGFSGTVIISYQWWETGDEEDSAWHGPYTGRASTPARITITITALSTTPTPTPTATGKPTPTSTAVRPTPARVTNPATVLLRATATAAAALAGPQLASTGAAPTGALGAGTVSVLLGGGLLVAAARRRPARAGAHRAGR